MLSQTLLPTFKNIDCLKDIFAINLIMVVKKVNVLILDRWLASGVAVLAYSEKQEFKETSLMPKEWTVPETFFLRTFEPWVQQES
jgi:hypothetical protein